MRLSSNAAVWFSAVCSAVPALIFFSGTKQMVVVSAAAAAAATWLLKLLQTAHSLILA